MIFSVCNKCNSRLDAIKLKDGIYCCRCHRMIVVKGVKHE